MTFARFLSTMDNYNINQESELLSMGFSILFFNPKFASNVGTMARNAELLGCEKLYVAHSGRVNSQVGATDTAKSFRRIGEFVSSETNLIKSARKSGSTIIAVELEEKAVDLLHYDHPDNALYVVGSEDVGLPQEIMDMADHVVVVPAEKPWSYNAADAATIVMYDRYFKMQ